MKKLVVLLLLGVVLITGCENKKENGKEKENKEMTEGIIECTKDEKQDNGSIAKVTVYAEFEKAMVTKANSEAVYSDSSVFENVCKGIETSNKYNEKKVDFTCKDNTLKLNNYFDQSEKSEYSRDEFYAKLINAGYECVIKEK